jgi:hypothetical protein
MAVFQIKVGALGGRMNTTTIEVELPQVIVTCRTDLPADLLDELRRNLSRFAEEVSIRRKEEPEYYGAAEWALPALLLIYVAKPLIDGFLEEIGAGGARSLKNTLTKLFKKLKEKENTHKWIPYSALKEYVERLENGEPPTEVPGRAGPPLSIELEIEEAEHVHYSVYFCFPPGMNEDQFTKAIEHLPSEMLKAVSTERTRIQKELDQAIVIGSSTYVYFRDQSKWQKV